MALETQGLTHPLTDSSLVIQLARLSNPSAAPPAVNDPTNVVVVDAAAVPVTGAVSEALNEERYASDGIVRERSISISENDTSPTYAFASSASCAAACSWSCWNSCS